MSIAKMKELENKIVATAVKKGYEDPREKGNPNGNTLRSEDSAGNRLRRYITGFRFVENPEDLDISNNVRFMDVNQKAVDALVGSWVDRVPLRNPIMIDANGPGKPKIESGCHRFQSWFGVEQGPLPAFELSPWYYESTGERVQDDTQEQLSSLLANISANPKPKTTGYQMEDQAFQILGALALDPTLEGRYPVNFDPSKDLPQKYAVGCIFDKALEYINQSKDRNDWWFSDVPPVSQIMSMVKDPQNRTARGKATRLRTLTTQAKIVSLERCGWSAEWSWSNPRKKNKQPEKRFKSWDKYTNKKTGNKVIFGNTKGWNYFNGAWRNVFVAKVDGKEMPNGLDLFFSVDNPQSKLDEFRDQQRKALKIVEDHNRYFAAAGAPQVENVLLPKQLIDERNKDVEISGPDFVQQFDNMFP